MNSDEEFFDQSDSEIIIQTPPIYQTIHDFLYGYMHGWSCHTSSITKILSIGTAGSVFLYNFIKLMMEMRLEFDLLKGLFLMGKAIVASYASGLIYPIAWIFLYVNIEFKISYP